MAEYYYDATDGDDGNTGTSELSPWQDFHSKYNNGSWSAGDRHHLKDGEVWRGGATAALSPSDGASGNPITITRYGSGVRPELRASTLVSSWTDEGSNVWSATLSGSNPAAFVWHAGTRLDDKKGSSGAVVDAGDWFHDTGTSTLYIFSTVDPGGDVEAAIGQWCILDDGAQSYITWDGVHLSRTRQEGCLLRGNTDYTFTNCEFSWIYHQGFGSYGTAEPADDIVNFRVLNSVFHDIGGSAINLGTNPRKLGVLVRGNEVYDCCFLDDAGVAAHDTTAGIKFFDDTNASTGLVVENNHVHDNGHDGGTEHGVGIWIDTWPNGEAIVRFNRVVDNYYSGIVVELCEDQQVYYNLCLTNGKVAADDHEWQAGISLYRAAQSCDVWNNVCYGNRYGIVIEGDTQATANNVVQNNIAVASTEENLYVGSGDDEDTATVTHNCFGAEATDFISWNGTNYSTYDAWETAYGGGTSSVEDAPGFVNAGGLRINLLSDSSDFSTDSAWDGEVAFTLTPVTSALAGQTAMRHDNLGGGSSKQRIQVVGVLSANPETAFVLIENIDATLTDLGIFDDDGGGFVALGRLNWSDGSVSVAASSHGTDVSVDVVDEGIGPNGGQMYRLQITGTPINPGNVRTVRAYVTGIPDNTDSAILHHIQLTTDGKEATDYLLHKASPCRRAGTDVGLGHDFFGRSVPDPPDIGYAQSYYPPARSTAKRRAWARR